eukprot:47726-Rhodomonas_salina.1
MPGHEAQLRFQPRKRATKNKGAYTKRQDEHVQETHRPFAQRSLGPRDHRTLCAVQRSSWYRSCLTPAGVCRWTVRNTACVSIVRIASHRRKLLALVADLLHSRSANAICDTLRQYRASHSARARKSKLSAYPLLITEVRAVAEKIHARVLCRPFPHQIPPVPTPFSPSAFGELLAHYRPIEALTKQAISQKRWAQSRRKQSGG